MKTSLETVFNTPKDSVRSAWKKNPGTYFSTGTCCFV